MRKYIDIKGKVHIYKYLRSESTKKPKCEKCHYAMRNIFVNTIYLEGKQRQKIIGYYCIHCSKAFIYSDSEVYLIKKE